MDIDELIGGSHVWRAMAESRLAQATPQAPAPPERSAQPEPPQESAAAGDDENTLGDDDLQKLASKIVKKRFKVSKGS